MIPVVDTPHEPRSVKFRLKSLGSGQTVSAMEAVFWLERVGESGQREVEGRASPPTNWSGSSLTIYVAQLPSPPFGFTGRAEVNELLHVSHHQGKIDWDRFTGRAEVNELLLAGFELGAMIPWVRRLGGGIGKTALLWQFRELSASGEASITGTSTEAIDIPDEVRKEVREALAAYRQESVEPEAEEHLRRRLEAVVRRFGWVVGEVLEEVLFQERAESEETGEALIALGRIDHWATQGTRLDLIKRGLYARSLGVRRGAVLGLAYLNDPRAIGSLKEAIEREDVPWLRKYMKRVLGQMEKTRE